MSVNNGTNVVDVDVNHRQIQEERMSSFVRKSESLCGAGAKPRNFARKSWQTSLIMLSFLFTLLRSLDRSHVMGNSRWLESRDLAFRGFDGCLLPAQAPWVARRVVAHLTLLAPAAPPTWGPCRLLQQVEHGALNRPKSSEKG